MIPFRVFDRDSKITWTIINYHPSKDGGEYLAARDDDSDQDGEIVVMSIAELKGMKLLDFMEE